MLAIFDERVAKQPELMKRPHKDAVSALKDGFLANHFTSLYPDAVVLRSQSSFTFAYSPGATSSSSRLPRFHFAHKDNVFCMYQGFIKDFDNLVMPVIDDEGTLMIQAFQILRMLGQRAPKKPVEDATGNSISASSKCVVEDISGNCISVIYDSTSKRILLSGGTYYDHPIYWGIDKRCSLVISDSKRVVEKATIVALQFTSGHVYVCFKGHTGLEAIFMTKQPETNIMSLQTYVDSRDKRTEKPETVSAIRTKILQAERDMTKNICWVPPEPNVLKINTSAIILQDGKVGIGVLVRNSNGDVVMALSRRTQNQMPGFCPELQAFAEGVSLAVGFQFGRCEFESPTLNFRRMLGAEIMPTLMDNIAGRVSCLGKFRLNIVCDEANKAAHGLACFSKLNDATFWYRDTPTCIVDIIVAEHPDCPVCGRSLHSMQHIVEHENAH